MSVPRGQQKSGAQRLHSQLSGASSQVKHLNPPGYGVAEKKKTDDKKIINVNTITFN